MSIMGPLENAAGEALNVLRGCMQANDQFKADLEQHHNQITHAGDAALQKAAAFLQRAEQLEQTLTQQQHDLEQHSEQAQQQVQQHTEQMGHHTQTCTQDA